jgi:hypothetical protein
LQRCTAPVNQSILAIYFVTSRVLKVDAMASMFRIAEHVE